MTARGDHIRQSINEWNGVALVCQQRAHSSSDSSHAGAPGGAPSQHQEVTLCTLPTAVNSCTQLYTATEWLCSHNPPSYTVYTACQQGGVEVAPWRHAPAPDLHATAPVAAHIPTQVCIYGCGLVVVCIRHTQGGVFMPRALHSREVASQAHLQPCLSAPAC